MTNAATHAMIPCGHRCICEQCISQWKQTFPVGDGSVEEMTKLIRAMIGDDEMTDIIDSLLNEEAICPICCKHVDKVVKIFDC